MKVQDYINKKYKKRSGLRKNKSGLGKDSGVADEERGILIEFHPLGIVVETAEETLPRNTTNTMSKQYSPP